MSFINYVFKHNILYLRDAVCRTEMNDTCYITGIHISILLLSWQCWYIGAEDSSSNKSHAVSFEILLQLCVALHIVVDPNSQSQARIILSFWLWSRWIRTQSCLVAMKSRTVQLIVSQGSPERSYIFRKRMKTGYN